MKADALPTTSRQMVEVSNALDNGILEVRDAIATLRIVKDWLSCRNLSGLIDDADLALSLVVDSLSRTATRLEHDSAGPLAEMVEAHRKEAAKTSAGSSVPGSGTLATNAAAASAAPDSGSGVGEQLMV